MLKELVRGCRKRRRESQKKLYKMFYAYGMSICLRYADSRNEAVQILNDAFMKVFSNIDSYDMDRPFKPWLRQIIVNTAINHCRKQDETEHWEELDGSEAAASHDQNIISGITYDEIIDMVRQLSPSYRAVFNLYVIEGFKHKEIAEMLGISVGTSKSNLHKAKKNLQSILHKNLA